MTAKLHYPSVVILVAVGSLAWPQANRQAAPQMAASPAMSASARADSAKAMDELSGQLTQLNESQARSMDASQKMSAIYSSLHRDVDAVCKLAGTSRVSPPEVASAIGTMCRSAMSQNMQYLQLQTAMQNESRQFTTLSNVMKTKHDTVKNSIGNIR